ncbi:uncharacterized protein LOC144142108 [Haemaphysalis longicornis]
MLTPILSRIILFLLSSGMMTQYIEACNSEIPPAGPRLHRAKAFFGKSIRDCHKEILAEATMIPPHKLRKTVIAFCEVVNACRTNFPEHTVATVVDCYNDALQNKSSVFYTEIKLPYDFAKAVNAATECLKKNNISAVPYQVVDDGLAFWKRAVLSYGWN